MNATTRARPELPAHCDPAKRFIDILPARNGKRFSIEWFPHSDDYTPLAGYVVIYDAKSRTAYAVTEYPVTWGRGFQVTKVGGKGTDAAKESYGVECSKAKADERGEYDDRCECKGWMRWGHCKHADAVRSLILNGWI